MSATDRRKRDHRKSRGEHFTADEVIAALIDINHPDATVITQIDLGGDVLVGKVVRRISYDGFHNTITISGMLAPERPAAFDNEEGE